MYQRDAQVYQENGRISANTLTTGGVTVSGGYTQLEFQSLWHVPYNLQLLPQSYLSISGSGQPDYGITSFTAQYVEITFSYTPSVTGTPDVSGSPLFSRAEWLSDGSQSVLRLYLKETGGFYGYSVVWEEDGSLRFSFKHAPGSQSLAGKRHCDRPRPRRQPCGDRCRQRDGEEHDPSNMPWPCGTSWRAWGPR